MISVIYSKIIHCRVITWELNLEFEKGIQIIHWASNVTENYAFVLLKIFFRHQLSRWVFFFIFFFNVSKKLINSVSIRKKKNKKRFRDHFTFFFTSLSFVFCLFIICYVFLRYKSYKPFLKVLKGKIKKTSINQEINLKIKII